MISNVLASTRSSLHYSWVLFTFIRGELKIYYHRTYYGTNKLFCTFFCFVYQLTTYLIYVIIRVGVCFLFFTIRKFGRLPTIIIIYVLCVIISHWWQSVDGFRLERFFSTLSIFNFFVFPQSYTTWYGHHRRRRCCDAFNSLSSTY